LLLRDNFEKKQKGRERLMSIRQPFFPATAPPRQAPRAQGTIRLYGPAEISAYRAAHPDACILQDPGGRWGVVLLDGRWGNVQLGKLN
jgi:hypothetical protein